MKRERGLYQREVRRRVLVVVVLGRSYICLNVMVSWEEDKDEKIELKDMMLEVEKIKMNVNLPAGGGVVRGAGRRV